MSKPHGQGVVGLNQYLIHKYANLTIPVESDLRKFSDFVLMWGGGQERFRSSGIVHNVFTMTLDSKRYYVCFSEEAKHFFELEVHERIRAIYDSEINEEYLRHIEEDTAQYGQFPYLLEGDVITPDSTIFKEICAHIDVHISEIKKVLDLCQDGILPLSYLQKCLEKACALNVLVLIQDGWKPRIDINSNTQLGLDLDITDYIDIAGLLLPSITKNETILEYTKKCLNCGTYYQAKGSKAVFCREACRSSYRRRKKKM